MSTRKRNEYLDLESSDEDGTLDVDHEAASDSRLAGLAARSTKRRKIADTGSKSDDRGESNESDYTSAWRISKEPLEDVQESARSPDEVANKSSQRPNSSVKKRDLTVRSLKPAHTPGVIYLSRIPPFMRPSTVKTLLSTHGSISKIFLTPEPPTTYLRRKKGGGNKKHSFIDGWIEFARKKHAKQCVDAINGQTVGGKKGGWYRDDVWNAKYLRGFGWDDLMQGVRAEEREREERVRVGTKREGRERGEFLRNLERSKVEETRRVKRMKRKENAEAEAKKRSAQGSVGEDTSRKQYPDGAIGEGKRKVFERRFRQNEVKGKANKPIDQPDDIKRVLSKIF